MDLFGVTFYLTGSCQVNQVSSIEKKKQFETSLVFSEKWLCSSGKGISDYPCVIRNNFIVYFIDSLNALYFVHPLLHNSVLGYIVSSNFNITFNFRLSGGKLASHLMNSEKNAIFLAARTVTLKPIPVKPAVTSDYDEHNMKLGRPQSPHLTIYAPQLTSMLSITHRMTGKTNKLYQSYYYFIF